MAEILKGLFGAAKSSVASAVPSADADFADFAAAPSPVAAVVSSLSSVPSVAATFSPRTPFQDRPFTKWYNIHERVSIHDFYAELFILPFILVVVAVHVWGTRTNRRKAKGWINSHGPALASEFAVVGFNGRKTAGPDASQPGDSSSFLKEKSKDVFVSYATGRQNTAFVDVKIRLYKRYNPLAFVTDAMLSFFFDSMPAPEEKVEVRAYPFDGKEGQLVPRMPGSEEAERRGRDSGYDGFVWAIVHKDSMKRLRDERYDLSLTTTKDHPKLPLWATIMSENGEISDSLLTADLIKAVESCGEDLESLIITDMPEDAPKSLDDLQPKKRLQLTLRLSNPAATSPTDLALFSHFLRMPDHLVSSAHYRPEVMRRVRATREDETKKIRRLDEDEKAEGRKTASDRAKKDERERRLKGMTADEQRKFLEREREKGARKSQGRKTMKA